MKMKIATEGVKKRKYVYKHVRNVITLETNMKTQTICYEFIQGVTLKCSSKLYGREILRVLKTHDSTPGDTNMSPN